MPDELEQQIIDKKIKFYVIDANKLAADLGLGARINTLMQTCFFSISGVLPQAEAVEGLKNAIKKSYGRKGDDVVKSNFQAVDAAVAAIQAVTVPAKVAGKLKMPAVVPADSPEFVRTVTATLIKQKGDSIAVSQMPEDGTWPTGTTQYEKRNIAVEIPEWNSDLCIQCAQCSLVCPMRPFASRPTMRRPWPLHRRPSSVLMPRGRNSPVSSSPSRWLRKIAPGAAPVSGIVPGGNATR
jgi:pyruvate-ferredoxin/flavodoxin oxidoreductase